MADRLDESSPRTFPAVWKDNRQKIVTNVISIQETQEAMDTALQLLTTFLEKVYRTEPGCQLFLLNRDDERFQYVTYEIYEDHAAVEHHLHTQHMKSLIQSEKDCGVKRGGNDIHHETLVAQIGPRALDHKA